MLLKLLKDGSLIVPDEIPISDSSTSSSFDSFPTDNLYLPRYTGTSGSVITALNCIGIDSSYEYRKSLAIANDISNNHCPSTNPRAEAIPKKGGCNKTKTKF